jgi:hypothetical protein
MRFLSPFFTILIIGAAGGIVYTLVTNPAGVKALFDGVDALAKTSYATELGKVA